jgi:hypothetical protein
MQFEKMTLFDRSVDGTWAAAQVRISAVCMAMAVACGGASNSNNGTIHGFKFNPADASASFSSGQPGGQMLNTVEIVLSTAAICDSAQRAAMPSGTAGLTVEVDALNQSLTATSYSIAGTHQDLRSASVTFRRDLAAACNGTGSIDAHAVSGTVTIDSIDANSVQGGYDATLDSGDHITGSFNATRCQTIPSSCF